MRLTSVSLLLSCLLLAPAACARQAARLELRPPRAVADSFDPVPVEVLVFVDEAPVPSLPEDLGARIVGGSGHVHSEWLYDAASNSWAYCFKVHPDRVGLMEVEFYHRELDGIGAIGRFGLQVLLNDQLAPPRLYRADEAGMLQRIDPTLPIYLLPGGVLHVLYGIDEGDLDRIVPFLAGEPPDFALELIQLGELRVTASVAPEAPGVRQALVFRDQSGRRPDLPLVIRVIDPCLICGGAHHEDIHPQQAEAQQDLVETPSLPLDPDVLGVADAVLIESVNLVEPAPTYLQTRERTAVIRGWVTERLASLDAVLESPTGERRLYPALNSGRGEKVPFLHTFRLKSGNNRIFYLISDTDGTERQLQLTLFRVD